MAYYLAVDRSEEDYEAVKIKKSGYFGLANSNIERVYECTLEEIDGYTSKFPDYGKLMHCLASEGLLSKEHANKPLGIIYTDGIEVRKVVGEILYSDMVDYLKFPELLVEYIKLKGASFDVLFFRALASSLPDDSMIKSLIAMLATSMEDVLVNSDKPLLARIIDNPRTVFNEEELLNNIANALVYETCIDKRGELTVLNNIDCEKFHATLSFVSQYERNLSLNKGSHTRKKEKPQ